MRIAAVVVLLLGLAGAGCTDVKPLDKEAMGISTPDEMQAGPGLFSGQEGAFTYESDL